MQRFTPECPRRGRRTTRRSTVRSPACANTPRGRGWEIPREWEFTDEGWSGSTLVRPALERLRDLSVQRLVERVVCLSPDRLARNYAHQVVLVEELTRNGTEVVFIHNPVATTPEQALMVQFQGMIAEYG